MLAPFSWSASHIWFSISIFACTFLLLLKFPICYTRDTILVDDGSIRDKEAEILVSAGEKFQLGFFTPEGSSDTDSRRYVGIWYNDKNIKQREVVWVANRNKPLSSKTGILVLAEDGQLKLLDESSSSVYWSAGVKGKLSSSSWKVTLMDSGNLVLSEKDEVVWQSFDNPTHTFLPGMRMKKHMRLISWRDAIDPGTGEFTFQLAQNRENQYTLERSGKIYWKSQLYVDLFRSGDNDIIRTISYLLSNFSGQRNFSSDDTEKGKLNFNNLLSKPSDYNKTRLILNYDGRIQLFFLNNVTWAKFWSDLPSDYCDVFNLCGNFSSCNSQNMIPCKCLPGFKPKSLSQWNKSVFSDGCVRKTPVCNGNIVNDGNFFSFIGMVKGGVGIDMDNAEDCKKNCTGDCYCDAYAYGSSTKSNDQKCWIWSREPINIQEYDDGQQINVRAAKSGTELTKRDCGICGTNIIPYPLSTESNCGDPKYYSFRCNDTAGQVSYVTPNNDAYRVTNINRERRIFSIHIDEEQSCGNIDTMKNILHLNKSQVFNVISNCSNNQRMNSIPGLVFSKTSNLQELEIQWEEPEPPLCNSSISCSDFPNSHCNTTGDKTGSCQCNASFKWDPMNFICTSPSEVTEDSPPAQSKGSSETEKLYVVFLGILASTIIIGCAACCMYNFGRKRVTNSQGNRGNIQGNIAVQMYDNERHIKDLIHSCQFREEDKKGIDVPYFSFKGILAATDNFSEANKLGQGGFGPVYMGKFPGGQYIAIKRLSSGSGQGLEEFKNEVLLIAKLQHRNLVRLLGYCIAGDEKILLYEYMPNKSLDSFIFDRTLCVLLDWEMRFNIILGIARGLLYLHQDSRLRIIHRDLKTSNVLLDEELNPKISDFGLARIFGGKETEGSTTRVVGTYGYMSPEYALEGTFSIKSDVFSFGVVVLEIITGKKNTGFYKSEQALSLLGYAWKMWKENTALDMMDVTLSETCNASEFMRCVNVGLLCVQEDPSERPTMSNVLFMLGSETASLSSPKQPAFVVRRSLSSTASSSIPEASNELTATLEEGR